MEEKEEGGEGDYFSRAPGSFDIYNCQSVEYSNPSCMEYLPLTSKDEKKVSSNQQLKVDNRLPSWNCFQRAYPKINAKTFIYRNPMALIFMTLLLCNFITTNLVQGSPPQPIIRPEAEKGEETLCEQLSLKCIHGICRNDTDLGPICICDQGWSGTACDSCGGRIKLTGPSGYIIDGVNNYTVDTKCTWLVESDGGAPIRFRFHQFATECSWDHLYVFDGDSVWDPMLAAYSGLVLPGSQATKSRGVDYGRMAELTAISGHAYIHFYSDAAYNMGGFNISYVVGLCPMDCSDHGDCGADGKCACHDGWTGSGCEVSRCPSNCSFPVGQCVGTGDSMACDCKGPGRGDDCSVPLEKGFWQEVTAMGEAPTGLASSQSLVYEDDILMFSGYGFGVSPDLEVFRYTLQTNTWSKLDVTGEVPGEVPARRYGHSVALYKTSQDKYVAYMFGGLVGNTITDEVWKFKLGDDTWQKMDMMDQVNVKAVVGHTAHVVGSKMHVLFGHNAEQGYLNDVQEYDLTTSVWKIANTVGAKVKGSYGHSSVYSDGRIFVHAGYQSTSDNTDALTDVLYSYDPTRREWRILRASGYPKYLHSVVMMNGLMLVFGGNTHNDTNTSKGAKCYSSDFMAYDIACDSWHPLDMPHVHKDVSRFGLTSVVYNGSMHIMGGFNGRVLQDMYRYQPGNCSALQSESTCLAAREGRRCAWADDSRCVAEDSVDTRVKNKDIRLYSEPECQPISDEESQKKCPGLTTCPSCTSTSYNCQWCSGKCLFARDEECTRLSPSVDTEEECLANHTDASTACRTLQNCNACNTDPDCQWSVHDRKCATSEDRLREIGSTSRKAITCPTPCHTYKDCANCSSSSCMWCSNEQRCVASNSYVTSFPYGQCREWTTMEMKCPDTKCENLRTCDACQNNPDCGWCYDESDTGLGLCMSGAPQGPVDPGTPGSQPIPQPLKCAADRWYFTTCPLCQCNGHSQCYNETDTCFQCEDFTTGSQCQHCAPGYYGKATNGGNCTECQCNDQADYCNANTGRCYCRTKGVVGELCDKCDESSKYYGDPKNGGQCYYNLSTNYQFTFNLSEDKENRYHTHINFMNTPKDRDRDVEFSINCSRHALMNMSVFDQGELKDVFSSVLCLDYKNKFSANEYEFGENSNTTFYVHVYDFTTPIIVQVSFVHYGLPYLKFIVVFLSCFLSLLLIAAIVWKVKQKCDMYRRRQRMVVQMEQMASRPFAYVNTELPLLSEVPHAPQEKAPDVRGSQRSRKAAHAAQRAGPSPIALEPLSGNKAAILSLIIRLPNGDEDYAPPGQAGLAIGSALLALGNHRKNSVEHQKRDQSSKSRKPSGGAGRPDNCV